MGVISFSTSSSINFCTCAKCYTIGGAGALYRANISQASKAARIPPMEYIMCCACVYQNSLLILSKKKINFFPPLCTRELCRLRKNYNSAHQNELEFSLRLALIKSTILIHMLVSYKLPRLTEATHSNINKCCVSVFQIIVRFSSTHIPNYPKQINTHHHHHHHNHGHIEQVQRPSRLGQPEAKFIIFRPRTRPNHINGRPVFTICPQNWPPTYAQEATI